MSDRTHQLRESRVESHNPTRPHKHFYKSMIRIIIMSNRPLWRQYIWLELRSMRYILLCTSHYTQRLNKQNQKTVVVKMVVIARKRRVAALSRKSERASLSFLSIVPSISCAPPSPPHPLIALWRHPWAPKTRKRKEQQQLLRSKVRTSSNKLRSRKPSKNKSDQ